MASRKRIQSLLLLLGLLCVVGCTEAKRNAPRSVLLIDSPPEDANGKGKSIKAVVGVAGSQSALMEEFELEEGRMLLGNETMSNTLDYSGPSYNHDHDPRGGGGSHRLRGNEDSLQQAVNGNK